MRVMPSCTSPTLTASAQWLPSCTSLSPAWSGRPRRALSSSSVTQIWIFNSTSLLKNVFLRRSACYPPSCCRSKKSSRGDWLSNYPNLIEKTSVISPPPIFQCRWFWNWSKSPLMWRKRSKIRWDWHNLAYSVLDNHTVSLVPNRPASPSPRSAPPSRTWTSSRSSPAWWERTWTPSSSRRTPWTPSSAPPSSTTSTCPPSVQWSSSSRPHSLPICDTDVCMCACVLNRSAGPHPDEGHAWAQGGDQAPRRAGHWKHV